MNIQHYKVPSTWDSKIRDWISFYLLSEITICQSDSTEMHRFYDWTQFLFIGVLQRCKKDYLLCNYFVTLAFGKK